MFIELDQAIAAWGSRAQAARTLRVSRQRIEQWIKHGLPWEAHTDSQHPAAQLCALVARKGGTTQKALLSASIKHKQRGK